VRQPLTIEMEYEVLLPGHVLYPHFTVYNEEGVWLFSSIDTDPAWRRCPRPAGHYINSAVIPGNLFNEGTILIGPAIRTEDPPRLHFYEREAIAFEIIDNSNGDSARVDEGGKVAGVIRPLLPWKTQFISPK